MRSIRPSRAAGSRGTLAFSAEEAPVLGDSCQYNFPVASDRRAPDRGIGGGNPRRPPPNSSPQSSRQSSPLPLLSFAVSVPALYPSPFQRPFFHSGTESRRHVLLFPKERPLYLRLDGEDKGKSPEECTLDLCSKTGPEGHAKRLETAL